jgi:hypothetical protein
MNRRSPVTTVAPNLFIPGRRPTLSPRAVGVCALLSSLHMYPSVKTSSHERKGLGVAGPEHRRAKTITNMSVKSSI